MEFNCEGKNGGNNDGIMMYTYGVDHIELCGQFFVLTRETDQFVALDSGRPNGIVMGKEKCVKDNPVKRSM